MNSFAKNGNTVTGKSIPVLHIIKSLGRGGAEMLLPETLNKHDKNRYQFHYIYFIPWKYQMVEAIEKEGGRVTCLSAKNNIRILLKARQIASYVRKNNIELIHCHLPWAGIVGRLVGKMTGVPVVYTEHNTWERYHKLTYYLNKISFPGQEKVIAVSEDVANSIRKHYHKKKPDVRVVSNGINTEKYSTAHEMGRDIRKELNIPDRSTVIGITCVFRKQKRLDIWLDIASELHKKHPDTFFIIVGDGVLKKEIHEKAQSLKMEKYLHFAGLQSETRPYLQAMNIFMMTSGFEGLPIALLEAMSMGCTPACTAAGGIPELVNDNQNGILVPVEDPILLVSRLSEYLQQPGRLKVLAESARETVTTSFSLQKMVSELETIYDEILN
ncbi:MAG TPA: glycosyltransferase [Flavitalea sp.]|nr:glycosyltransferase [Flavitalea sp.]